MMIKPVKTERDYQKALKEIEKLWDAKPNTAKGDRLEVLITLVEAFEQKHPHGIQAADDFRVAAQSDSCRAGFRLVPSPPD